MKMSAIRITLVTLLLALLFTSQVVVSKVKNPGSDMDKSNFPLSENDANRFLGRKKRTIHEECIIEAPCSYEEIEENREPSFLQSWWR
ncbi:hypothetical protein ACROYT_G030769 [Oculina patagonica]